MHDLRLYSTLPGVFFYFLKILFEQFVAVQ